MLRSSDRSTGSPLGPAANTAPRATQLESRSRTLAMVALIAAAPLAQAGFTTLTLPTLDADLRSATGGAPFIPLFPGTPTWNGVPFQLAVDARGNTAFIGPALTLPGATLDIPVGVFGVTQAYTIINSAFGQSGATNGSIEFLGSDTGYLKVDLIQGVNIRDYLNNVFNNSIDGVNAMVAFAAGQVRLDEQIYNLPADFADETLTTIRFTSLQRGNPVGDPFIVAATVRVPDPTTGLPEPESLALVLASLGLAGWMRRRQAPRA